MNTKQFINTVREFLETSMETDTRIVDASIEDDKIIVETNDGMMTQVWEISCSKTSNTDNEVHMAKLADAQP